MKVENLLVAFVRHVQRFGVDDMLIWGQFVIVLLSLLLGYVAGYYVQYHVKGIRYTNKRRTLQVQGLVGLVFPLVSFVAITSFKAGLQWRYPALYLLDLVAALLMALLVLRAIVYALQIIFASKQWLKQSERWVIWMVWLLFALYVTGCTEPVIVALDSVSFRFGKTIISLWDILQTVVVVAVTLMASLLLSHIIESRLLRATTGDASLRVVVARLIKASIIVLAFMIALPLVGIDLTLLSVFGGALGVGLGLGLQKIASNYVSGFILLLDRSLRIGDMVEIGTEKGQVQGLTARYIILKSLDGRVFLIPNDTVISTVVVNKTYTDKNIRVGVPLQIAYNGDLRQVMQLMLEATKDVPRILAEPAPNVEVKQFTPDGILVEVGFWIVDEEKGAGAVSSAVSVNIWESFTRHGIRFSCPHRDISLSEVPDSMQAWLPAPEKNALPSR